MRIPAIALLGLTITLPLSPSTHAQIVAAEDFESYAAGSPLAGQGGGSGFSGRWAVNASRADDVTIVDASLSYASGPAVSDGGSRALQFTFEPAEGGGVTDGIMSRALETAQTGTAYMSMLFRDIVNPDFATDFIQWGFSDGTANPQASIIRRNGSLQVRSTTTPNNSVDSGVAASVGTTHMLVFKAEKSGGGNYDRISLFVDPDSELEPAVPSAVATVDSGLSSFPNFIARSAFHGEGDTFQIDNIVISSTWKDAVISSAGSTFPLTITNNGVNLDFEWESQTGMFYVLRTSTDLEADLSTWDSANVAGSVENNGLFEIATTPPLNMHSIPRLADLVRFYRVQEFPLPPVAALSDDFESGQGGWTVGSDGAAGTEWQIGTPTNIGPTVTNSGVSCFGTNLSANYELNADVWLRSPPIDLTGAGAATLSYAEFHDIEIGFDSGTVNVVDASDDSLIAELSSGIDGQSTQWNPRSHELPAEALGKIIKIEFRLQSDDFNNLAGWYIDDVVVTTPAP